MHTFFGLHLWGLSGVTLIWAPHTETGRFTSPPLFERPLPGHQLSIGPADKMRLPLGGCLLMRFVLASGFFFGRRETLLCIADAKTDSPRGQEW